MIFICQLKIRRKDPRLGKAPNMSSSESLESGDMLRVLVSFLSSSETREPQLRKCLHEVVGKSLGHFLSLMWKGLSYLGSKLSTGRWFWGV